MNSTAVLMLHARDAEDTRLLDSGDLAGLVREFNRGKRYGETPYRVVVHKVVDWTLGEYFPGEGHDPAARGRLGGRRGLLRRDRLALLRRRAVRGAARARAAGD